MIPQVRASIVTPALIGVLLVLSLLLARRPYYNWDMFPYMAIVMVTPGTPFDTTHRHVYQAAKAELPGPDYLAIASRQPALRDDPEAFREILKYFTIKPGYTLAATLFYHLGIPPVMATWLPSVISYFLLGLLLYAESLRHAPPMPAALFVLIVALSPTCIDLARYSSPDMLCTLVSAAGFILILRSRSFPGLILLLASVWIRPDAAIVLALTLVVLLLGKRITWLQSAALAFAATASLWLLTDGTSILADYLLQDSSLAGQGSSYIQGLESLIRSFTLPAIALALGTMYFREPGIAKDLASHLLLAAIASLVARYLLHPYVEDRFNLPVYLLILLIAWETVASRQYPETRVPQL